MEATNQIAYHHHQDARSFFNTSLGGSKRTIAAAMSGAGGKTEKFKRVAMSTGDSSGLMATVAAAIQEPSVLESANVLQDGETHRFTQA